MPVCAGIAGSGERCRRHVRNGTHCFMHHTPQRLAAAVPSYFSPLDIEHVNSSQRRLKLAGLLSLNRVRNDTDARALVASGILHRIIDFALDSDEDDQIRDRALWVLINLTSVPGDTGAQAILRMRPDFFTIIAENIALHGQQDVINYLWCLGNMASSVPVQAIAMIDSELHTTCVNILKDPRAGRETHRYAVFLLLNLASQTSQLAAHEIMTELADIPPIVLTNLSLLADLFWLINRLYLICRHVEIPTAVMLVNSLDLTANKAVKPAIETIADICSGNNSNIIMVMVTAGLIVKLHKLMYKPLFSPLALFCLSNLACEAQSIPCMLDAPGLLMDIFSFASRSRDAVWTLSNLASRGDHDTARALLRCGIGSVLFPLFDRADDLMKIIILEALIGVLKQARAVAYVQFTVLGMGRLPETHANPQINTLLAELRHESERFVAVELPPPLPHVEPAPLSLAANLAAARMTEVLAHGGGPFIADVSDLVFTGADVTHLVGLGFRFRADGMLIAS
jgi:hypothetical protein